MKKIMTKLKEKNSLAKGKKKIKKTVRILGAGNEIRTRDIHLGKVTLYH